MPQSHAERAQPPMDDIPRHISGPGPFAVIPGSSVPRGFMTKGLARRTLFHQEEKPLKPLDIVYDVRGDAFWPRPDRFLGDVRGLSFSSGNC